MDVNIERLALVLKDAGLNSNQRQNPIYNYRNSQSRKIVSVAMDKLKPGQYVTIECLKAHVRSSVPNTSDKTITKALYKIKNIRRVDGLWRMI
jgi:hypothetical protein